MKTGLKKKDFILVLIVGCAALAVWGFLFFTKDSDTGTVVVKVDGDVEGVYDLNKDQEIIVNGGTNILKINNGEADMIEADCPDQICVKQRPISADHENIICLPNKVVVEVESDVESEIDSSTN